MSDEEKRDELERQRADLKRRLAELELRQLELERAELNRQLVEIQNRLLRLTEERGPSIIAATVAAARGGVVGKGGRPPFTPRAKKVLELALREALSLGHNYIGTEHVLFGLAGERDGVAARILRELGIDLDPEKVRAEIVRIVGGGDDPTIRGGGS
jgi:hypothetical protein